MKDSTHINIGQVIAIHAWLSNTNQTATPVAPDTPDHHDDVALVVSCWQSANPGNGQNSNPIAKAQTLLAATTLVSGLVLGTSITSVALTYTGNHPVNLLMLLGLLVGLPTLTLFLSLFGRLIGRLFWRRSARGIGTLVTSNLANWNPQQTSYLDEHLWRYGPSIYWFGQQYMQRFALSFLCMSLITLLCLITFSDIAFGWSSTLQIEAARIYQLTQALSLPWQSWLPVAHPSFELIEASRFYRMTGDNDPALLGQWWPFVAMCLAIWGIGPRLAMAWLARHQTITTTRTALLNHPEVTALLRRLRQAPIGYTTDTIDQAQPPEPETQARLFSSADVTVAWNGAAMTDEVDLATGQGASAAQHAQLLAAIPATASHIRIVVKGWEPPLLEFLDFVQSLRRSCGNQIDISVLPLPPPGASLSDTDVSSWRSVLARLRDSKVFVEAGT